MLSRFNALPCHIVTGHRNLKSRTLTLATSSVFDPRSFLAGASAGGYAVMAAHLPTLVMNWREINSILEWAVR